MYKLFLINIYRKKRSSLFLQEAFQHDRILVFLPTMALSNSHLFKVYRCCQVWLQTLLFQTINEKMKKMEKLLFASFFLSPTVIRLNNYFLSCLPHIEGTECMNLLSAFSVDLRKLITTINCIL